MGSTGPPPEAPAALAGGVTTGALTQADAPRKWRVDVSTVIKVRRDAEDGAMTAFAAARAGRSEDRP